MANKPINFKQERDFGDLFNATFSFISQEYKQLASAILYFVFPLLLFSTIAMTVYSIKSNEMVQSFAEAGMNDPLTVFTIMGSLFGYLGVAMVISLAAYAMMMSAVYGYIKLFIQHGPQGFTVNDVWAQIAKNFLNSMLAIFVIGLVVGIGFVFCILPGIYLGVALSIVLCIMIFEEKSFTDAFGRSIKLINKSWWQTFAVIIITTIIMYMLMLLLSVPSLLFGFKSFFMNIKSGQPMTIDLPISYYVLNAITQLFSHLIMVIPIVISAFIYYGAVEKVEKPSLMNKISQINADE